MTMSDDIDDELPEAQWTPDSHERLRAAGAALIQSIAYQLTLLNDVEARTIEHARDAHSEAVEKAAIEYSDAYFDFAGDWHPFGFLEPFDTGEEKADPEESPKPSEVVSILLRADFRVTDEDAVLLAGRQLAQEDSGQDADAIAIALGRGAAIYQLIHRHGLESLNRTDGLEPLGAITQIIEPEEVLVLSNGFPNLESPNGAFAVGGRLLFGSEDRWGD